MSLTPSIIVTYGPPKFGKSFDIISMAGASFLTLESKGAASSVARQELHFEPAALVDDPKLITNIDCFLDTVEAWNAQGVFNQYAGVYVDEATFLLGDSMVAWRAQAVAMAQEAAARDKKVHAVDSRWEYRCLDRALSRFRKFGRELPAWLILNFHEHDPYIENGVVKSKGAPEVPSSRQLDVVPAACHMVLHVEDDPMRVDASWPRRYNGNPLDPQWITADRNGIFSPVNPYAPMNLREILGSRGTWFARPKGLEWLDDWASSAAEQLAKGAKPMEIATMWLQGAPSADPFHLRWALRDGIARYAMSRRNNPLDAFSGSFSSPAAGPPQLPSAAGPPQQSTVPAAAGAPVVNPGVSS